MLLSLLSSAEACPSLRFVPELQFSVTRKSPVFELS